MDERPVRYKVEIDDREARRRVESFGQKLKKIGHLTKLLTGDRGGDVSSTARAEARNATRSTADGAPEVTASGGRGAREIARELMRRAGSGQSIDNKHLQNLGNRAESHLASSARSVYAPLSANNAGAGAQVAGAATQNVMGSLGSGLKAIANGNLGIQALGAALGLTGVAAGVGLQLAGQGLNAKYGDLQALAGMERFEAQSAAARGSGRRVGRFEETGRRMLGPNTLEVESEFQENGRYKRAAALGYTPEEAARMNAAFAKSLGGARQGVLNPFSLELGAVSPQAVASLLSQSVGGGGLVSNASPSREVAFLMKTAQRSGLRGSGIDRYVQQIASQVESLNQNGIKLSMESSNDFLRGLERAGVIGADGQRLMRGVGNARQQALEQMRAPLRQMSTMALMGAAAQNSEDYFGAIGYLDKALNPLDTVKDITNILGPEAGRAALVGIGANVTRGEDRALMGLSRARDPRSRRNLFTGGSLSSDAYSATFAEARRQELVDTEMNTRADNNKFINNIKDMGLSLRHLGDKVEPLTGVASSLLQETANVADKLDDFIKIMLNP